MRCQPLRISSIEFNMTSMLQVKPGFSVCYKIHRSSQKSGIVPKTREWIPKKNVNFGNLTQSPSTRALPFCFHITLFYCQIMTLYYFLLGINFSCLLQPSLIFSSINAWKYDVGNPNGNTYINRNETTIFRFKHVPPMILKPTLVGNENVSKIIKNEVGDNTLFTLHLTHALQQGFVFKGLPLLCEC